MAEYVQNIGQSYQIHHWSHGKLENGIYSNNNKKFKDMLPTEILSYHNPNSNDVI